MDYELTEQAIFDAFGIEQPTEPAAPAVDQPEAGQGGESAPEEQTSQDSVSEQTGEQPQEYTPPADIP